VPRGLGAERARAEHVLERLVGVDREWLDQAIGVAQEPGRRRADRAGRGAQSVERDPEVDVVAELGLEIEVGCSACGFRR
jgi:hypothetical protein